MKPPPLIVDIVEDAGDWPGMFELRHRAGMAVRAAAAGAETALAPGAEASVVFTDDRRMRALNWQYRHKDVPTNVLSFPAGARRDGRFGPLLGDIFLGLETISEEAEDQGLAFADHVTHLIVHGFLHLIGHDHVHEAEADVMELLETAILAKLGIADPYRADPAQHRRR